MHLDRGKQFPAVLLLCFLILNNHAAKVGKNKCVRL